MKARLTQQKKSFNLGMRTVAETNDPEKVIFNFSDRTLSSAEKSLLAKGLNLSVPPKNSIMVTYSNPLNHSTPVFLDHKQTLSQRRMLT